MKALIISCRQKHMSAKNIAEHVDGLRSSHNLFVNEKTPTIAQIYHIINTQKPPKMLHLGQLIEWCEENDKQPSEVDKPFVIGFEHSDESTNLDFKIVVSTERMLKNCAGVNQLCVDATYKLNWNGYPFMVIGI